MKYRPFDRAEHLYFNSAFDELIKDAIRFFNGTPVHPLQSLERFHGTGVYALYYIGDLDIYEKYAELNRLQYGHPIYIGKAVPKGWRQARTSSQNLNKSYELNGRLKEHFRNIEQGQGLKGSDFTCRFVIFEETGSDMIGTIEASLIKIFRPLWNSAVDGFGNHDPGAGRYNQAKSDWDVLHPGRIWADRCLGQPNSLSKISGNIKAHMEGLQ